ncbi:MAG: hypothetical protein ACC647_01740 [Anaerolineales bacterium]
MNNHVERSVPSFDSLPDTEEEKGIHFHMLIDREFEVGKGRGKPDKKRPYSFIDEICASALIEYEPLR